MGQWLNLITFYQRKSGKIALKIAVNTTPFHSIGSDHRIVTCKGQIIYRKIKPPEKDPIINTH